MPSPTFTERRLWRNAYLLMAFQTAQDSKVNDFSTAATRSMWASLFEFDPGVERGYSEGGEGVAEKIKDGWFSPLIRPSARLAGQANPKTLEWLLRSWGGSWSGSPTMTLTLTEALNEYATLALVEKAPVPNTQKLVRAWDMWAHRLRLVMSGGLETLRVEADFIGRDYDRTALNDLGGITLPASFVPPGTDKVFAPHQFRLYRDPAGANVSLAVEEFELILEQGASHEHWNDRAPEVRKTGYTTVRCRMRGIWQDETYAIATDGETVTPTFKRFQAEWVSGAASFVVNLRNVDWNVSPTGWDGKRFRSFEAEGEALLDLDAGAFVTITLTP
jgi:hypothetical protein